MTEAEALDAIARQLALANLIEWHRQLDWYSEEACKIRARIKRGMGA